MEEEKSKLFPEGKRSLLWAYSEEEFAVAERLRELISEQHDLCVAKVGAEVDFSEFSGTIPQLLQSDQSVTLSKRTENEWVACISVFDNSNPHQSRDRKYLNISVKQRKNENKTQG